MTTFQSVAKRASASAVFAALLVAATSLTGKVSAYETEGFLTSDQGVLAIGAGLPRPRWKMPDDAGFEWAFDWTNDYRIKSSANESLEFDLETLRLDLGWAAPLGADWGFRFTLPLLHHSGGTLDGLVDGWHDLTGLPSGNREFVARDRINVFYRRNGEDEFRLNNSATGIGDASFELLRRLGDSSTQLGLRLDVPTGDSDKLLGNGGAEAAFWLTGPGLTESENFAVAWTLGAIVSDGGDLTKDGQEPLVPFGRLVLSARFSDNLDITLQGMARGRLYSNSELRAINGSALQLAFGFQWRLDSGRIVDIAMLQDPVVETSADVGFHIRIYEK